jgi:glutathione S-transferase
MPVVLRGPAHSTLPRTARLAMEEKGVAHALREADLPQAGDRRPGRAARHRPWDAPVLEHDGFSLSETAAITRYVDEAFPGAAPRREAGMRHGPAAHRGQPTCAPLPLQVHGHSTTERSDQPFAAHRWFGRWGGE